MRQLFAIKIMLISLTFSSCGKEPSLCRTGQEMRHRCMAEEIAKVGTQLDYMEGLCNATYPLENQCY